MRKLSQCFVSVHFINEDQDLLTLKYQLFENTFLNKWLSLMERSVKLPGAAIQGNGHFYGKYFNNEQFLEKKLNALILAINQHLSKINRLDVEIKSQASIPMSTNFLNDLHTIFEKLDGDRQVNTTAEISAVLQDLNIAIHQAEQFTFNSDAADHVQVLITPPAKNKFEASDYELFDMDYEFGVMYLTYGMTGVPTRDAFLHQTTATPQSIFSNGMYLSFFEAIFKRDDEFKAWMTSQGLNHNDPTVALGHIPLGKMIYPETVDSVSFLKKLAGYKKIINVSFSAIITMENKEVYSHELFSLLPMESTKN